MPPQPERGGAGCVGEEGDAGVLREYGLGEYGLGDEGLAGAE
jgi:hypothetical protein